MVKAFCLLLCACNALTWTLVSTCQGHVSFSCQAVDLFHSSCVLDIAQEQASKLWPDSMIAAATLQAKYAPAVSLTSVMVHEQLCVQSCRQQTEHGLRVLPDTMTLLIRTADSS